MKQIYLFTLFFILLTSFNAQSQVAATYVGVNSGNLSGVPFTFTNTTTTLFATNLDGSGFSAAPISLTTPMFQVQANDNWTVTFDTAISNLRLYCRYSRTSVVEFDQPF